MGVVDIAGVSMIGTSVAQSAAGAPQAERTEAADRRRAEPARARPVKRSADEYDHPAADVDAPDAVRHLAGNDQEQAREDRREHPAYLPDGRLRSDGVRRLDIQA